ncbi:dnaJ homolog subfamily C member 12 [Engraulis encrasicolus]|uniref:dnaJ homolog subfamily C member 12 n=1 Tax=Engraulis encrasicolus TaxID=184585 RepID=UPI002FD2B94A
MDSILNCKQEDLENYYGLLGCDELSSTEQILNEYKIRALACHPDKHPENPKAVEEFQRLQEAKEVLTNEESRKNYDLWLRSQLTMPYRDWRALSQSVKTSMHWAVRPKKEPMLEEAKEETVPPPVQEEKDEEKEKVSLSEQEQTQEQSSSYSPLSPSDYWHQRFRWSADAPSDILLKFRNYEI